MATTVAFTPADPPSAASQSFLAGDLAFINNQAQDTSPRTNSYLFKWTDSVTKKTSIYNYRIYRQVLQSDGTIKEEQLSLTKKQWEGVASNLMQETLNKVQNVATSALFNAGAVTHVEAESEADGGLIVNYTGKDAKGNPTTKSFQAKDFETLPEFHNDSQQVQNWGSRLILGIELLRPEVDNSPPAVPTPVSSAAPTPVSNPAATPTSKMKNQKPPPSHVQTGKSAATPSKPRSTAQAPQQPPDVFFPDSTFPSHLNAVKNNLRNSKSPLDGQTVVFAAKAIQTLNGKPVSIIDNEHGAPIQISYRVRAGSQKPEFDTSGLLDGLNDGQEDRYIPLHMGTENQINHFTLLYRKNGEWHFYDSAAVYTNQNLTAALCRKLGVREIKIDVTSGDTGKLPPQDFRTDKINCGVYVLRKINEEVSVNNYAGNILAYRENLAENFQNYFETLRAQSNGIVEQLNLPKPQTTPIPDLDNIPLYEGPERISKAHIRVSNLTPYDYADRHLKNTAPLLLVFNKPSFYNDEITASTDMPKNVLGDQNQYLSGIHRCRRPASLFFEQVNPTTQDNIHAALFNPIEINENDFDTNVPSLPLRVTVREKLEKQIYSYLQLAKDKGFKNLIIPEFPKNPGLSENQKNIVDATVAEIFKDLLRKHFANEGWTIAFTSTLSDGNHNSFKNFLEFFRRKHPSTKQPFFASVA